MCSRFGVTASSRSACAHAQAAPETPKTQSQNDRTANVIFGALPARCDFPRRWGSCLQNRDGGAAPRWEGSIRSPLRPRSAAGSRRLTGEDPGVAYVYLLRCADDSLYCGWTTDVERRLAAHRSGTASRYTRSRRPVELVFVLSVADRSAALREEARIKRLSRAGKLRLIEAQLAAT
jgi:putative endonuclease